MSHLIHPSPPAAVEGGRTIGTPRRYEAFSGLLFAGRRRAAFGQLAEAAGIARGDYVLDVGCGDGLLTAVAAAVAGPAGSAMGIDAGPEMIAYARRRHPEARFEVASADAIPAAKGHFDAVLCCLVLHHLAAERRAAAVGEMARVLKPGGRLLLAEITVPNAGPMRLVARVLGLEGMARAAPALRPLLAEAGLGGLATGAVPPWLCYASGRAG